METYRQVVILASIVTLKVKVIYSQCHSIKVSSSTLNLPDTVARVRVRIGVVGALNEVVRQIVTDK